MHKFGFFTSFKDVYFFRKHFASPQRSLASHLHSCRMRETGPIVPLPVKYMRFQFLYFIRRVPSQMFKLFFRQSRRNVYTLINAYSRMYNWSNSKYL